MLSQEDILVSQISELYEKISRLDSLKPSQEVNNLYKQLVQTCLSPIPIDVTKLNNEIQEMRSNLIRLYGEAQKQLEDHYSSILASFDKPLDHLHIYPSYSRYQNRCLYEYNLLSQHLSHVPKRAAFLGSGPLPLTSIVFALNHLPETHFDNYDHDPSANEMAARLVEPDPNLSGRMKFHTKDVLSVGKEDLKVYDVVFVAAMVGINKEEKVKVINHLAKNMALGSILMTRSVHGARAFLHPIVDPDDLFGFEILSIFHPTDETVNSVVIAKKTIDMSNSINTNKCD